MHQPSLLTLNIITRKLIKIINFGFAHANLHYYVAKPQRMNKSTHMADAEAQKSASRGGEESQRQTAENGNADTSAISFASKFHRAKFMALTNAKQTFFSSFFSQKSNKFFLCNSKLFSFFIPRT